jgi:hypothetical protein
VGFRVRPADTADPDHADDCCRDNQWRDELLSARTVARLGPPIAPESAAAPGAAH